MIARVCGGFVSGLLRGEGGREADIGRGDAGLEGECATYTWFSPLGANTQAATHMATMMARPMKMLHLF